MFQASTHANRRIIFVSILTCLVAIVVCSWNWQTVRADDCVLPFFQPVRNLGVGHPFDYAGWLAVDDFNRDGKPDMAVTHGDSGHVSIYLGDGIGRFSAPSILPTGPRSVAVSTGDFDQDGNPDLVVGSGDGTLLYFGDGAGGFSAPITIADGGDDLGAPYDIAVSDFNQDGKLDLAIGHSNTGLDVLLGNGSGGFSAPVEYIAGSVPYHISVADFNNDGKPDLVTGNVGTGNVSILIGDGSGGFSVTNLAITPSEFGIGDFNGDTKTDLVVGYADNPLLLLGDGLGGFTASSNFPTPGSGTSQIRSADFNGDGKTDIAVFNKESENVEILVGDGAGGLSLETTLPVGRYEIHELVIADLNTDGKPDILLPNSYYTNVSILLNNGVGTLDTVPPVISIANSTVDAPGHTGVKVSYLVSAFDNSGRTATLSCDIPPGSVFPIGTTPITCTATDYCGNTGGEIFNITVVDQHRVLTFEEAPTLAVGSNPYQIAISDFNRDGRPDMAVTSGVGVAIMLGDGTGNFSAPTFLPSGFYSTAVTAADFNGDGNPDLAVFGNNNGDGVLHIYLGDGTGGFVSGYTLPNLGRAFGIAVGDMNHDNKIDLVIARFSDSLVTILPGDGAGGFSNPVSLAVGSCEEGWPSGAVSVGDFNSDGNSDIAVSIVSFFEGYQVKILFGDGAGNFPTILPLASGREVAVDDFNQDGKLDLAGAWFGDVPLIVNFGDGSGNFTGTPGPNYSWGDVSSCIGLEANASDYRSAMRTIAADLNADGHPDVLVSDSGTNKISILLGNGTGSFSAPIDFAVGSNPTGVSVADFNLDGKPDIATPNYSDGSVSVLLNSTYQTPIGVNSTVVVNNTVFTFDNVTAGGTTAVTPIDPATVGQVPGGFAVSSSVAYEIATTASFTGSVTLAFKVPDPISLEDFNSLAILHNENGTLVDVTATTPARDYATRTIYATTTSFSPFYLARRGPHIRTLFDQTKAHKSGSTIHIKLQVLNASSSNVSSSSTTLTVRDLKRMSGNTTAPLADSSNEDPDYAFRYEPALGGQGGGYAFKLKSTGFAPGQYVLSFYVGNDRAFFYTVKFEVR